MDPNKPQSPANKKAAQQSRRVSLGEYRAVVADLLSAAEKRASEVEMAQRAAEAMLSSLITGDQKDEFLAALATLSDTTKALLKKHADEVNALKANLAAVETGQDLPADMNSADGSTVGEVTVDTSGIEEALRTVASTLAEHLTRLTDLTNSAMQQWMATAQQQRKATKVQKEERKKLASVTERLGAYLRELKAKNAERFAAFQEKARSFVPASLSNLREKLAEGKDKVREVMTQAAQHGREKAIRAKDRTKEILEHMSALSQATKERLGKFFGLGWLRRTREKKEKEEGGTGMLRRLFGMLGKLNKADSMGGGLGLLIGGGALLGMLSGVVSDLIKDVPGIKQLQEALDKLPNNVRAAVEWANEKLQPVLKVIKETYNTLETKGAELREFLDRYLQRFADALGIKPPSKAPDENKHAGYDSKGALPPVPKSFVSPTREQTAAELERFRNSESRGPDFRGPVMPLMRGSNSQELPDNYRPVIDRNGVVRFISPEGNYAKDRQGNLLSGDRNDEVIRRRMEPDKQEPSRQQDTQKSAPDRVQAPVYGGATVQRHGFDPMSIPNALSIDPTLGGLIYGGQ